MSFLCNFIYVVNINAATINAASCSLQDVQAAIDSAIDGDVVLIPEGTCTWNSAVNFSNKGVTIKGAGIDMTIITDETPGGYGNTVFWITGEEGKPFRITGITFNDTGTTVDYNGVIYIKGTCKNFRIDHCKFVDLNYRGMTINGYTYGVIDHCIFENLENQPIDVRGDNDASWDRPLAIGTANAVYIEDNIFNNATVKKATLDSYFGARWVFRYNIVTNSYLMTHGTESSGDSYRSTHSYEIYGNTFISEGSRVFHAARLRGGTGVVFDNTFSGIYTYYIDVTDYCTCKDVGTTGCSNSERCITYPCLDQIGRSTDSDGNGIQDLEPLYEWNNTIDGADTDISVFNFSGCDNPSVFDHIQENRDYYNDTQRPGYAPYEYPHPLTLTLLPPQNARIE